MTSWKWLAVVLTFIVVLALRGDHRSRHAMRWAVVAIVGVLLYETVKYHAA